MPAPRSKLKIITALFCAAADLALAGEARAATYYADCAAAAGGNGSLTSPFRTVADVNNKSFQNGDDVYFKCGCVWSGSGVVFNIDWGGAGENNRAIVGAYFGSGTVVNENNRASCSQLPKIDGNLDVFAWTSQSPPFNDGTNYSGLINLTGESYVTIENFSITESGGRGINITNSNHITVQRCEISKIMKDCIGLIGSSDSNIVYNWTDLCPVARLYNPSWYGGNITVASGSAGSTRNYVAFNQINRSHGEGIDIIKNTTDTIVEYNLIQNVRRPALYFDRGVSANVMRYNLVYCPNDPPESGWWPNAPYACAGIEIRDEDPDAFGRSHDNVMLGNIVLNATTGMALGSYTPKEGETRTCVHDSNFFVNNTVVNSTTGWNGYSHSQCSYSGVSGFYNNILYCNGESGTCQGGNTITNIAANLVWDYNLIYGGNIDTDSDNGSGTVLGASPNLARATGFVASQIPKNSLTGQEFAILSTSPAKNRGMNLVSFSGYVGNLDLNNSNFLTGTGVGGNGPESFALVRQENYESWDIGADVYATGATDTTAPAAPSGLSVR